MTKADQVRLQAWRFRMLQQAAGTGNVSQPAGISAFPGRPSTSGRGGLTPTVRPRWATGHGRRAARHDRRRRTWSARSCICASGITSVRARSPATCSDSIAVKIAVASVHRLLQKHGMNRLPANQKHQRHHKRWQRYEKPQPGHRLQLDVKFLERIAGTQKRLYQFTAIDDCTRIRVLKVYDACNQRSAIRFMDEVLRRLPFRVHVVQTDNGAEFQSAFHWHLERLDIRHAYIRPRSPHLNGKVERSHRVDDQEFYQLLDKDGIRDDIHLFNEKLREWEDYYNYHRPHGALDGQTPYERLLAKTSAGLSPKA